MNLICLHLFQEDFQVNNCLSLVMSTVLLVMADVMMIKTMVMKNRLIWIATNSGWKWLSFLCLVIVNIGFFELNVQTGLHSLYTQTVHIFESNKTNRPRYTPKWRQNSVSSILVVFRGRHVHTFVMYSQWTSPEICCQWQNEQAADVYWCHACWHIGTDLYSCAID